MRTGRLFRQDRLIVVNIIRATFAGWLDRFVAVLVLLTALAVVHSWFADRPWRIAAWAVLAGGTIIGIGAGRLVAGRLAFHAFDGVLAADALQSQMRQRYMVAWHGIGMALLAVVTMVARPSLLVVSVPAYIAGGLVSGLPGRFWMQKRLIGLTRLGRTLRAWSCRPSAGITAALVLLLLLLPGRTLGTNALMAAVGIGTMLFTLMLTSVDNGVVRFMMAAGHGLRRILMHHSRGAAFFLVIAVPGCWALFNPVAGGIVAATGGAMLFLQTLRVLAYRLHGKRFADLLVSLLIGLLMLVAYSMPLALPLVALIMLWQLQRRGRMKTWLLA
ncbi:hypothetical protein [Sphingomonas hankookensis]|uniref:hypothetical protein n=1 Tax=Sphingomonas hankookensis TaxID=563996 RepID=UPI00267BAE47